MKLSPTPLSAIVAALLWPMVVLAQGPGPMLYQIELEKDGRAHVVSRPNPRGQPAIHVTVQFKVLTLADGQLATDVVRDEIVVEEDGRRVTELEILQPRAADPLTVVLGLDISGSMGKDGKIDEAKRAARLFLDTLHPRARCGLILFDHELRPVEPPTAPRAQLRQRIESANPAGGTAWLDAAARAISLLAEVKGRRAVLVLTDGVDLNSRHGLPQVIDMAKKARVPVYTLGVGEPGRRTPVTSVLVLDRSGSMNAPAEIKSKTPKIRALHRAAGRFVDLMRPGARTTLLPFGTTVETPAPFTDDKKVLKERIDSLKAGGETALFDATYAAIATLEAAQPAGKQAVVVLTDGIDNRSRRRVEEVISRAQQAGVPLHVLGLGRPGELDERVLKQLAAETGGEYHHAVNEAKLFEIFEELSIQLHDDGIDLESLRQLAEQTGGKFYHARHAADLRLYYQELADELQNTYTVTFPSRRPTHDGTSRGIDISVVRNGSRVSAVASVDYNVHGVVVPKLNRGVYLGILAIIGLLLLAPLAARRLYRRTGW